MPFPGQQSSSPQPSEAKDDGSKTEWKLKSGPSSPLAKTSSSSNLVLTHFGSSLDKTSNDVDDDELPSFTPSMRPATTQSSDRSNSFLVSQTSGFQSESDSLPSQSGSQIFSGFQSQSSYISEAGYSDDDDYAQADDDDLPDDDFPPAPTLIRQTGYYKASTSRSCSCLEPEERTDGDSYIYSR